MQFYHLLSTAFVTLNFPFLTFGEFEEIADNRRLVCYYHNFPTESSEPVDSSLQDVDPFSCTHIIYAFALLDVNNACIVPSNFTFDVENGGYRKVTNLKEINRNLKVMLSIKDDRDGLQLYSLIQHPAKRYLFIKNTIRFLYDNYFDGIDLFLRYYSLQSKREEKEAYSQLVEEKNLEIETVRFPSDTFQYGYIWTIYGSISDFYEGFKNFAEHTRQPRLLLSMNFEPISSIIDEKFDIPQMNKYVDFFNVQSYSSEKLNNSVSRNAPLYATNNSSNSVDSSINNMLSRGASSRKLNLGIPFYGILYTLKDPGRYTPGSPFVGQSRSIPYYQICREVKTGGWRTIKNAFAGSYSYKGNMWVAYQEMYNIKFKVAYAEAKKLGGVVIWSIEDDDSHGKCHGYNYPLLKTVIRAQKYYSPSNSSSWNPFLSDKVAKNPNSTTETPTLPELPSSGIVFPTNNKPSWSSSGTTLTPMEEVTSKKEENVNITISDDEDRIIFGGINSERFKNDTETSLTPEHMTNVPLNTNGNTGISSETTMNNAPQNQGDVHEPTTTNFTINATIDISPEQIQPTPSVSEPTVNISNTTSSSIENGTELETSSSTEASEPIHPNLNEKPTSTTLKPAIPFFTTEHILLSNSPPIPSSSTPKPAPVTTFPTSLFNSFPFNDVFLFGSQSKTRNNSVFSLSFSNNIFYQKIVID